MNSGAFAVLNKSDGMRFVGFSSDLITEEENTFRRLVDGRHANFALQKAFDNTGDVWTWIILELCPVILMEQTKNKWLRRGAQTCRVYNLEHLEVKEA
jgi:hypothetical protein